jgi:drug/metabolite transporter (DMT)-like permease
MQSSDYFSHGFLVADFCGDRRLANENSSPLFVSDRWRLVGLGLVGYYLSSFLDFLGLQYITAGLERLILFLTLHLFC